MNFEKGMKVKHNRLGVGVVHYAASGDYGPTITVLFESYPRDSIIVKPEDLELI